MVICKSSFHFGGDSLLLLSKVPYFEKGFNCFLRGDHGVGKTAIVMECFENKGLLL